MYLLTLTPGDLEQRTHEAIKELESGSDKYPPVKGVGTLLHRVQSLGPAYVIGGALRSWACGEEPHDLDLGVDVHPEIFHHAMQEWYPDASRTALGGYKLTLSTPQELLYNQRDVRADVFALGDNYGKAHMFAPGCPATLPRGTFLNWDAIVYDLRTQRIVENGWFDAMRTRVVHPIHGIVASRPHMLAKIVYFLQLGGHPSYSMLTTVMEWVNADLHVMDRAAALYAEKYESRRALPAPLPDIVGSLLRPCFPEKHIMSVCFVVDGVEMELVVDKAETLRSVCVRALTCNGLSHSLTGWRLRSAANVDVVRVSDEWDKPLSWWKWHGDVVLHLIRCT